MLQNNPRVLCRTRNSNHLSHIKNSKNQISNVVFDNIWYKVKKITVQIVQNKIQYIFLGQNGRNWYHVI